MLLRSTRNRRVLAIVVVVLAGLLWWWWPQITDEAAGTDVAIVGDSFLRSAEREVTYRIHEDGFSLVWADPAPSSWCEAADAVRRVVSTAHPSIVVVSFRDEGICGGGPAAARAAVTQAAAGARVIVVTNPAADPAAPAPVGAAVVDPTRLLGPDGTVEEGCLWFDACLPNGRVAVREADGALAPSGQTRVARLIVTALR
jgi:hypothetical protein